MSFRDDLTAMDARRETLSRELSDIRERKRELDGLRDREKEIERALQETSAVLSAMPGVRDANARRLPLLDRVRIAAPCPASWDAMEGNGRVRFCGECKKNVYDLSAMTRDEAEDLLQSRGEDLCARFYRRADGTVLTSDCSVGVRIRRAKMSRFALVALGGGLLASAGATFATGLTPFFDLDVSAQEETSSAGEGAEKEEAKRGVAASDPTHAAGSHWWERLTPERKVPHAAGGISFEQVR